MTKKHFETIASTLAEVRPRQSHPKVPHGLCQFCGHYGDDCTGRDPFKPDEDHAAFIAWSNVVSAMRSTLARTNPRFDGTRFENACRTRPSIF